jgi:hypothetical protein
VGACEHDMKMTWGEVEFLRPPLEFQALVPAKVRRDGFKGLLLTPWWPRQNSEGARLLDSAHPPIPSRGCDHLPWLCLCLSVFFTGLMVSALEVVRDFKFFSIQGCV